MPAPLQIELEPGRVYRTRDFRRWGTNPSRLAHRLLREEKLVTIAPGMFLHARKSRFGSLPAEPYDLVRAFLGDDDFVFTGPDRWNPLDLGSTAVFAKGLVYNRKRSGDFRFGNRTFTFRRVNFPKNPPAEWYAVDLFEHAEMASVSRDKLLRGLGAALRAKRLDPKVLRAMSDKYASEKNRRLIEQALAEVTS